MTGRSGKSFGLELVGELAELVEINSRPETERVGLGPRNASAPRGSLAKTGADRTVDRLLERDALLARALFQEPCKIIVDGQRGAHVSDNDASRRDVKASSQGWAADIGLGFF